MSKPNNDGLLSTYICLIDWYLAILHVIDDKYPKSCFLDLLRCLGEYQVIKFLDHSEVIDGAAQLQPSWGSLFFSGVPETKEEYFNTS